MLLDVLLGLVRPGLVLLQFVPPVGLILAVVDVAGERLGSGVGLGVSPQLAGLYKTLTTGLTLETLVSVVSSDVSLQQCSLRRPVLATVEGAPVYSTLVNSPVSGQVGAVLAGVGTDLALELLLVRVDGLVLLQGGLLGEQLPAGLAAELLLAVVLLVFLQVVGGLGPEGAVLMLTDEGLVRLVTGLVSQHLLDPAVLVGAPGTFVGRRTSYVARLDMLVVILDPGTLEGTEGTAVLLVLPVNFLVDLQFVRGGAAEGTLAALDAVL